MFKNTKIALIPLIASISFMLFFWVTTIRKEDEIFGLSVDLAGGLIMGAGLGVVLSLMYSLSAKQRRR